MHFLPFTHCSYTKLDKYPCTGSEHAALQFEIKLEVCVK